MCIHWNRGLFSALCTVVVSTALAAQPIEDYSAAYQESSSSAHWSAYVPIAILLAAGVGCAVLDKREAGGCALGAGYSSKSYSHSSRSSRSSHSSSFGYGHY